MLSLLKKYFLAVTLLLLSHSALSAAVLVEDSGVLIGINGLDVNGTVFDVRFEGGSYTSVFGNARPLFDSVFGAPGNIAAAQVASGAIRNLLVGSSYENAVNSIGGCTNGEVQFGCLIATPFALNAPGGQISQASVFVRDPGAPLALNAESYSVNWASYRGEGETPITWGKYELSAIPIPSAAWLFGSALLGLAVVKRRKA